MADIDLGRVAGSEIIISETEPVTREDGSALLEGDLWIKQSTWTLYRWTESAWVDKGEIGGSAGFPITVTPTDNVGNLKANTEYEFNSMDDFVNSMLVSYKDAYSLSGSVTPNNGGTFETGRTINITGGTVSVRRGTKPVKTLILNDGTKDYSFTIDDSGKKYQDTISHSFTFDAPVAISSNRGGFTYKATYEGDTGDKTLSGTSASFNFQRYAYYGFAELPSGEVTNEYILGLPNKKFASNNPAIGNIKGTLSASQYVVIAVPTSFGAPVYGTSLGDETAVLIGTIEFTNASGSTISYSVYRNNNSGIEVAYTIK